MDDKEDERDSSGSGSEPSQGKQPAGYIEKKTFDDMDVDMDDEIEGRPTVVKVEIPHQIEKVPSKGEE